MNEAGPFVDIHCHLIPGLDDGSRSWDESLEMAEIAVADGIGTIIVTTHQLGNYAHNRGDEIRARTAELQELLDRSGIALRVLPGADVRIEDGMGSRLRDGDVLTLGDHRQHLLLELPHELYFPLEPVLHELEQLGIVGILSHPERNQGLLKSPALVPSLVDNGCLMQVTAGSLMGTFGPFSQQMSEWMLREGCVHFVATDAHGPRSRRPLIRRAFERVAELTDEATSQDLCCHYPAAVAAGEPVAVGRRRVVKRARSSWFSWRKAA